MAVQKKDGKMLSLKIDRRLYDALQSYCDNNGVTKTKVLEDALGIYFDLQKQMKETLMKQKFEFKIPK